jgi:hypothetical protein
VGAAKLIADLFLAELLSELAATTAGVPDLSYVAAGAVPLDAGPYGTDDAPCNGQAWVTYSRMFPTVHFPTPVTVMERCLRWGIEFQIGVTRCIPIPEQDWTFDDIATSGDAMAATVYSDAGVLANSIHTVITEGTVDYMGVPGEITPYGPSGGVVGSIGTVQVDLTASGFC